MKKVRIVALVMVLAFTMIGGAYAWWSQDVFVNATVSTGELNVEWESFFIRDAPSGHHSPKHVPPYVEADAYISSSDRKTAILTIDGLYPVHYGAAWGGTGAPEGDRVAVTGHMQNMGAIPVKLNSVEIDFIVNQNDVAEWMRADVRVAKRINGTWTVIHHASAVPLKDLPSVFDHTSVKSTVLGQGDLLGFGDETLYIYLDQNAPNSVQGSKLQFAMKLNFIQHNAP